MALRVAVLRCRALPRFVTWDIPDQDALFADDRALIAALERRGITASAVVWSDPAVVWDRFDVAVIRSTWDYIDEPEHFLAVLAAIEASTCTLVNPFDAVRWNSDKAYLFDLQRWGVPIVPTFPAAGNANRMSDAIAAGGWRQAVVKPTVGTGAADIRRVPGTRLGATLGTLALSASLADYLVQPLVESVMSEGEWSFIFFGGSLSHVLLKKPAAGDFRAHGIYGGTIELVDARPDDAAQARAMLSALPFELLYARIDLVRIGQELAVMELELIEPMLYFGLAPLGPDLMVDALLRGGAGGGT